MIRIQILSDLHTEFMKDRGKKYISLLDPENVDVLILAGDIAVSPDIPSVMKYFCNRYKEAKVIFVNGNHHFYGNDYKTTIQYCKKAVAQNSNLIWLDNDVVEIKGQRFIGTPLWFSWTPKVQQYYDNWSDFRCIYDFKRWLPRENKKSMDFLNKEMKENDIVITHYLPSWKCVAPKWVGNDCNCFFVTDQENLIIERNPKLWIFGHTHESVDININNTRMLCNPFGYVGHGLNPNFKQEFVINV